MTALARTPALHAVALVGALTAHLFRPRTRSVTTAQRRRFATRLKRLKRANTGHSPKARRTRQIDPSLPFPMNRDTGEISPKADGGVTGRCAKQQAFAIGDGLILHHSPVDFLIMHI